MSFFASVRNLFRSAPPAKTSASRSAGTGGVRGYVLGVNTSPMSIPTAHRCVEVIAGIVSSLPLRVESVRDGLFVSTPGDRLFYLLNVQPCPSMSAADFWGAIIRLLLLEGNAYVVPVYNSLSYEVESLVLCNRGTVSHDTLRDVYMVNDMANGLSGTYEESEILHFKHLTLDGKRGLSVISYARNTLDIADSAAAETLTRFADGGNVRGFLANGTAGRPFALGEYDNDELRNAAKSIDERFSNGEKIVELPGQVDFRQVTMTSADMQFLETRKFTVFEVCRFFGVPPSFVYSDTSNNYKSAENAYTDLMNLTLNPILHKLECELLRKLYPEMAERRRIIFDRREIYACDLESRIRYQTATIAAGLYTVNEWRAAENKPPVEGGDTPLVSANLRDLSTTSEMLNDGKDTNTPKEPRNAAT